jgi:hypothetical protein
MGTKHEEVLGQILLLPCPFLWQQAETYAIVGNEILRRMHGAMRPEDGQHRPL